MVFAMEMQSLEEDFPLNCWSCAVISEPVNCDVVDCPHVQSSLDSTAKTWFCGCRAVSTPAQRNWDISTVFSTVRSSESCEILMYRAVFHYGPVTQDSELNKFVPII